jgi:uncharacterized protein (DUF1810 family)
MRAACLNYEEKCSSGAQTSFYDQVTVELTEGRKRTHWMWFIFPQLLGLGHSSMAQRHAIRDLDQAARDLADP